MTRKQKLTRMILSKRLKKYGNVFTQSEHKTLRKTIKFADLLRAQVKPQNFNLPDEDSPTPPPLDVQDSESGSIGLG